MANAAFYHTALRSEFAKRVDRNPQYSLRAFAKALKISHASLVQILAEKRLPSVKIVNKLLLQLELDPTGERNFKASLAQAKLATQPKRISPEVKKWAGLAPVSPAEGATPFESRDLSLDTFRIISDWYHTAILEMTSTSGFLADSKSIASRLGISATEAELAIARMLELGLLERTRRGGLKRSTQHISTTDKVLTTAAHKKRQIQILNKSIEAIQNVPIEGRNHSAMTMAIDPEKIPQAKAMIQEFTRRLCAHLESGQRTVVFEFQTSLFPLEKDSSDLRRLYE